MAAAARDTEAVSASPPVSGDFDDLHQRFHHSVSSMGVLIAPDRNTSTRDEEENQSMARKVGRLQTEFERHISRTSSMVTALESRITDLTCELEISRSNLKNRIQAREADTNVKDCLLKSRGMELLQCEERNGNLEKMEALLELSGVATEIAKAVAARMGEDPEDFDCWRTLCKYMDAEDRTEEFERVCDGLQITDRLRKSLGLMSRGNRAAHRPVTRSVSDLIAMAGKHCGIAKAAPEVIRVWHDVRLR